MAAGMGRAPPQRDPTALPPTAALATRGIDAPGAVSVAGVGSQGSALRMVTMGTRSGGNIEVHEGVAWRGLAWR